MWCILSNMSHLVWIRSIFATYVQNIIEILTFVIIGRVDNTWHYRRIYVWEIRSDFSHVMNSIEYVITDELGLIVNICDVFDRIPHVWYIQWDILHVILSANICVRNSVGIFTCDVFCRKYHDCDEFGRTFSQLWKKPMELLTCAIFGQMPNKWHIWGE